MSKPNPIVADLIHLLTLERLEENLFRGESRDIGSKQVYGGQVLGQALSAAAQTVDDRHIHSLHAYFLRPGDMAAPIVYEVDRQRDGRSFSSRRVVAIQHGRPILNMAASFQVDEQGFDHQAPMPSVPMPEDLHDVADHPDLPLDKLPEKTRRFICSDRPLEFRFVEDPQYFGSEAREPIKHIWFRAADSLPDNRQLHEALLAYASDYGLMVTALRPHGVSTLAKNLQLASLDHAMWFHRPFRADEWLLYACDSPNAVSNRGLARGAIYNRAGALIASTAQEGLMRLWSE